MWWRQITAGQLAIFNQDATDPGSTQGFVWGETSQPLRQENGDATLIYSTRFEGRGNYQIAPAYVDSMPAYVSAIDFESDGRLLFHLADTNDDPDFGGGLGPHFTDAAENDLGMAVITPDTTIRKWNFEELNDVDGAEPYVFNAVSVAAAGPENNLALRNAFTSFWTVVIVLADRTDDNIDWDAVTTSDLTISILTSSQTVDSGTVVNLTALTTGKGLIHTWSANPDEGEFGDSGSRDTTWKAPDLTTQSAYDLTLTVMDEDGNEEEATITLTVRSTLAQPTVTSGARGGGASVTDRSWPLSVSIRRKDGKQPFDVRYDYAYFVVFMDGIRWPTDGDASGVRGCTGTALCVGMDRPQCHYKRSWRAGLVGLYRKSYAVRRCMDS